MSFSATAYTIFPLGDSALNIDFGNSISETVNKKIGALFQRWQAAPLPGMTEAVPAYSSLSIFYDPVQLYSRAAPGQTVFAYARQAVEEWLRLSVTVSERPGRLIRIPVCYDAAFAPDLPAVAKGLQLGEEEIIRRHGAGVYRVYMLGFLPGFPYLGELEESLVVPRKPQPVPVAAGSVAIAGRQTGIYPLASPGGWSVIGRTPLRLFDPGKTSPVLLSMGDQVEFYPVTRDEFEQVKKQEW